MLLDHSIKDPQDTDFKVFRDKKHLSGERKFIEELWKKYKPHADSHFRDQLSRNFKERFWEMYLGCSLMKMGLDISSNDYGPDIKTTIDGKTVWFEAIAPGPGKGKDVVPEMPSNGSFPQHKIILRFTSAIWDKYQKLEKYLQDGIVGNNDAFIISVNSSKISLAMSEGYPPYILKALFPLGNPIYTIDIEKREAVDENISFRSEVYKNSGQKIKTSFFDNPNFKEISGILYSRATPFDSEIGQDYFLIHNPYASNPIPYGSLKIGREAKAEKESISIKKWK